MTAGPPRGAPPRSGDLVVDASAVLSLLIDPGQAGQAIAERLRDSVAFALALLPFEVANVLRRRRNAGILSHAEAAMAHAHFLDLPIELWPWEAYAARAWALGANLTSYDAAYVALAESIGAPLLTRDARIAAAPGVACRVIVI